MFPDAIYMFIERTPFLIYIRTAWRMSLHSGVAHRNATAIIAADTFSKFETIWRRVSSFARLRRGYSTLTLIIIDIL